MLKISLPGWSRRKFCRFGAYFALPIAISIPTHCTNQTQSAMKTFNRTGSGAIGRLQSRPMQPTEAGTTGLRPLQLDGQRDGWLYVPANYQNSQPAPLVLMLHGAGGDAEGGLRIIRPFADALTAIVLAVDSRRQTWDVIVNRYGPDIDFIDQALAQTFSRYAIDPNRVGVAGFSDGASYALSVGITNGDLFTHILAFSPGFMAPAAQMGKPRVFISHGQHDTVLPIDRCSRRIVPQLQHSGYEVQYREFDGPHTVPTAIAQEAMAWFVA